jgi:hypothetical protein
MTSVRLWWSLMSAAGSCSSRGGKGVKRGWLIEKDKGSRRRSSMKADDGTVRAKSRAGRNPLVTDGG